MNLTPHFTVAEFVASAKAAELGIDNSLPPELVANARATAEMLERIRSTLSDRAGVTVPLVLSSGYRCPALNLAVGSSSTSDHPRAMAADWAAPTFGKPAQICRVLAPLVSVLGIGQLIYECPEPGRRWVHTSTRLPTKMVNRVITIGPSGTMLGIQEA
jgi:zinc D-Ala-D-Ala carboxypeptidase